MLLCGEITIIFGYVHRHLFPKIIILITQVMTMGTLSGTAILETAKNVI